MADEYEAHLDLLRVLQRVHTYSPKLQSDTCREYAYEIAKAASRGMISTQVVPGGHEYGFHWKITTLGLAYLNHHVSQISEDEQSRFRAHTYEGTDLEGGADA